MVGSPDKPVEEEEVLPVESSDQDPTVQTFDETVESPSLNSYLDFESWNWLGNNPGEDYSIEEDNDFDFFEGFEEIGQEGVSATIEEDKDFDFFEGLEEISQEGVSASEETSMENQNAVMFESVEQRSELCGESSEKVGVSSITSESMNEVKPELFGGMTEDIGASSSKSDSMIEAERNLCDDMSANLDGVAEPAVKESEPDVSDNTRPNLCDDTSANLDGVAPSVSCPTMNLGDPELEKTDVGDDDQKSDGAKGKTNTAESESETSSSSSSDGDSSSSEEESDEEESKKAKKFEDQMVMGKEDDVARELEEGEIPSVDEEHEVEEDEDDDDDEVNETVAWSNDEVYEPIRSKNELKELPPVPAVDVTLEPHHITLPVGAVLSVVSTKVIVEGTEKHTPLNEGSILWITERRTPLGLVDEIFGPVESPYYIVRFNSESEVPEGVSEGTPISFVEDFAQHITNIEELQNQKGYDASGVNDEEVSEDLDFSDDEKEAEYIRMKKMEKRGVRNDQKTCDPRNKKNKNRDLRRPTSSYAGEWTENRGSSSDPQMGGPVWNHQPRPQMDPNRGAWRPQSNQQNPYQRPPMPNLPPMQIPLFQPQFNAGPMSIPSRPGGLNFFQGQASASWPAFGMGRGVQRPQLPNELSLNLFAPQGFQMHQPQSIMNPQFQTHPQLPMNPRYNMLNPRPQSSMNPQFQMQPETRPQFQVPQLPTNLQPTVQPQSQGFQMHQPQSIMNPQFQTHPQSLMNPQFQMQPETRPQFQVPQLPTNLQPTVQPQSQGFQMHQPQFIMNPQFQTHPQSLMNPQFQMQPETPPQSQVPQFPTNMEPPVQPQFQGFSTGQSSERGRGHRGRGRSRGRGRF